MLDAKSLNQPLHAPTGVLNPGIVYCVLYCRVSDHKQKTEGDGLNSQEQRCRDYAVSRGYQVLAAFHDDITGGTDNRPGFEALIRFVQQHGPGLVVIIDDIKRFAREVEMHFFLKKTLAQFGARLESPLFRFEDTPEGKFMETMMAAQAELERNQNKRQVGNRMKSRLERGYWTFPVTPGYRYERHPVHKKWLVPDASAPLVKEILEGFARGRFLHPMEIERHLTDAGMYGPNPPKRRLSIRHTQICRMLSNAFLYAGFVEYPPWGVTLRQGQHEPIITSETYQRIRERLRQREAGSGRLPLLRPVGAEPSFSNRPGFPLRGFVRCTDCGRNLTASVSRGRTGKRYGYYHCAFRDCPVYGKTISARHLEAEFGLLLKGLTASDSVMETAKAEALAAWEGSESRAAERQGQREYRLAEVDRLIEELTDKAVETKSPVLLKAFETKLDALARERVFLMVPEKEGNEALNAVDAGTLFDVIRPFLQNPFQTWESGDIKTRQTVARLVLPNAISYVRAEGFGTPYFALPYQITATLAGGNSTLVDLTPKTWNSLRDMLQEWVSTLPSLPGV